MSILSAKVIFASSMWTRELTGSAGFSQGHCASLAGVSCTRVVPGTFAYGTPPPGGGAAVAAPAGTVSAAADASAAAANNARRNRAERGKLVIELLRGGARCGRRSRGRCPGRGTVETARRTADPGYAADGAVGRVSVPCQLPTPTAKTCIAVTPEPTPDETSGS